MNVHDATEQAFQNGRTFGYKEGYKDGIADGKAESLAEVMKGFSTEWISSYSFATGWLDGFRCKHCREKNDKRSKFCPSCGRRANNAQEDNNG